MKRLKQLATLLLILGLGSTPIAAQEMTEGEDYVIEEVVEEAPMDAPAAPAATSPVDDMATDEFVIPNSPILRPTNILTIRAIGMGVAPEVTISPAQALVLAKRAAIADAYRQLGEKMYGIRINAKDTIKDAVVKNSTVRTEITGIIRNAEIQETMYKDGLCQVEMEVKLDGRRWYRVLSGY